MYIVVLGASGDTGTLFVQQALDNGHNVRAVARNPRKINIGHANLEVVKGDVFSEDSLSEAIRGCDIVISALGHRWTSFFTTVNIYSTVIKHVINAMRKNKLNKLIVLSSWCTVDDSRSPKVMELLKKPLFGNKVLQDMALMEDYLINEACSDIEYTVVKLPKLTNGPTTGKDVLAVEGQFHPDTSKRISRLDVVKFIISLLENNSYKQKCIAVGVPDQNE